MCHLAVTTWTSFAPKRSLVVLWKSHSSPLCWFSTALELVQLAISVTQAFQSSHQGSCHCRSLEGCQGSFNPNILGCHDFPNNPVYLAAIAVLNEFEARNHIAGLRRQHNGYVMHARGSEVSGLIHSITSQSWVVVWSICVFLAVSLNLLNKI